MTNVNLKLIHKGQAESKVTVTFEAEGIGKTAAEFRLTDGKLSGFCICSSEEGNRLLNENKELLDEKLRQEQIQPGEIYFVKGDRLDLEEFSLREATDGKAENSSKILYRAAKAFIGYVQDTSIKKGNTAYEN